LKSEKIFGVKNRKMTKKLSKLKKNRKKFKELKKIEKLTILAKKLDIFGKMC